MNLEKPNKCISILCIDSIYSQYVYTMHLETIYINVPFSIYIVYAYAFEMLTIYLFSRHILHVSYTMHLELYIYIYILFILEMHNICIYTSRCIQYVQFRDAYCMNLEPIHLKIYILCKVLIHHLEASHAYYSLSIEI